MSIGRALVTIAIFALCAWLYATGALPGWSAVWFGLILWTLMA